MAFYEWVLKTPIGKDFPVERIVTTERFESVATDPEKPPEVRTIKVETVVREEAAGLATAVRLVSAKNDYANARYFVRFIFGRYNGDRFEPAMRDDGIVISGPNFYELMLDPDGSIDEPDLLQMCARILGWDGEMRMVEGAARVESTPVSQ